MVIYSKDDDVLNAMCIVCVYYKDRQTVDTILTSALPMYSEVAHRVEEKK